MNAAFWHFRELCGKWINWTKFRSVDTGGQRSVVPEPGSYAMLLAGLGIVGTIIRRRKHLNLQFPAVLLRGHRRLK